MSYGWTRFSLLFYFFRDAACCPLRDQLQVHHHPQLGELPLGAFVHSRAFATSETRECWRDRKRIRARK